MQTEQKNILIAGGAGFIGSHLCARLLREGHKVTVLDNFSTGREENVRPFLSERNFKLIKVDVCEKFPDDLSFNQIYNLASPASPSAYQKYPIQTFRSNVLGTLNLCELALKTRSTLLLASTSEIYGDPLEHPQKETYWGNVNPIGPRACYDEGKRAAETVVMDYRRQYSLPIKIVRIFNTYGPNMDQNDGRVVSNFINQALKNEPLTIYGSGSQTRSFQYVDDLIEGMVRTMQSPEEFLGPVNLGNPSELTMLELADTVLKLLPESTSKKEFRPLPPNDPLRRKPDISLAKQKLNWEPLVPLHTGLKNTINYFKSLKQPA